MCVVHRHQYLPLFLGRVSDGVATHIPCSRAKGSTVSRPARADGIACQGRGPPGCICTSRGQVGPHRVELVGEPGQMASTATVASCYCDCC